MKHTVKHLSKTRVQLTIEADKKDLAEIKQISLGKLAKKVKVPGFRKGKVPASVAEKHLEADSVAAQMIEDAASKFVIDAVEAEKIQVLERPEVDIKKFVLGEMLEMTAEADILPEVNLGEYKKLSAKRDKASVTAKEIDEVLDNLRRNQAEKKEVQRAAKDSDELWIDFEGFDKAGNAVPGAGGKEYPLSLGSNTFIPGFEEGLVGKRTGDEFDLPVTFPKDYHHSPLAGEKVTFKVKVNKVTEVVLPKLDDELAAKSGDFKNLDDLKADIKRELTSRKEYEVGEKYKTDLIDALLAKSEVPAPKVLIEDQFESLERDMQQNLMQRGLTIEGYLADQKMTKDEWHEKELRPTAEKRVKTGLLLAELSKAENIQIEQGELNSRLKEMLKQYPNMREQLNTPEARRDIANRALTEKTIDRLVELNAK